MEEIWKGVPDYEDRYQVSNLGRVKSLNFNRSGKIQLRKLTTCGDGYCRVILVKNSHRRTFQVHQLVAMAFLNHMPCGFERVINHINFNRLDNRLENLEVVTARENTNQKHIKSTSDFVGVSWDKSNKKWRATIVFKGKSLYLGVFDTELEASQCYENALLSISNGDEVYGKEMSKTSVYKGVYKKENRWISQISFKGEVIYLGSFDTEIEASTYYENAMKAIENGTEIKIKKAETSSKYKGVHWCNTRNRWIANINIDGKYKMLGRFHSEHEAYLRLENFKKEK